MYQFSNHGKDYWDSKTEIHLKSLFLYFSGTSQISSIKIASPFKKLWSNWTPRHQSQQEMSPHCLPLTACGWLYIPRWANYVLILGPRSARVLGRHYFRPSVRMALCWIKSRGTPCFGRYVSDCSRSNKLDLIN